MSRFQLSSATGLTGNLTRILVYGPGVEEVVYQIKRVGKGTAVIQALALVAQTIHLVVSINWPYQYCCFRISITVVLILLILRFVMA